MVKLSNEARVGSQPDAEQIRLINIMGKIIDRFNKKPDLQRVTLEWQGQKYLIWRSGSVVAYDPGQPGRTQAVERTVAALQQAFTAVRRSGKSR